MGFGEELTNGAGFGLYLDWRALAGACGFVNGSDDLHVAATELPRDLRISTGVDAIGEVVHVGGLLIDGGKS